MFKVLVFLESDDQPSDSHIAYDVYEDDKYDPKIDNHLERVRFWASRGIPCAVTCQENAISHFDPEQAYLRFLI